jgi:hypothetical protein
MDKIRKGIISFDHKSLEEALKLLFLESDNWVFSLFPITNIKKKRRLLEFAIHDMAKLEVGNIMINSYEMSELLNQLDIDEFNILNLKEILIKELDFSKEYNILKGEHFYFLDGLIRYKNIETADDFDHVLANEDNFIFGDVSLKEMVKNMFSDNPFLIEKNFIDPLKLLILQLERSRNIKVGKFANKRKPDHFDCIKDYNFRTLGEIMKFVRELKKEGINSPLRIHLNSDSIPFTENSKF